MHNEPHQLADIFSVQAGLFHRTLGYIFAGLDRVHVCASLMLP